MCEIDWGFVAALIAALSTFGLLCVAIRGVGQWKDQFKKQRNHDLALRLLRAVEDSHQAFKMLRSPTGLITDGDVRVPDSKFDDDNEDWSHRTMWARYRARQDFGYKSAQQRIQVFNEAESVWDDERDNLRELARQLSEMEGRVFVEAAKYVTNLDPNTEQEEKVEKDVLWSNLENDRTLQPGLDSFGEDYFRVTESIRDLVAPRIRMD